MLNFINHNGMLSVVLALVVVGGLISLFKLRRNRMAMMVVVPILTVFPVFYLAFFALSKIPIYVDRADSAIDVTTWIRSLIAGLIAAAVVGFIVYRLAMKNDREHAAGMGTKRSFRPRRIGSLIRLFMPFKPLSPLPPVNPQTGGSTPLPQDQIEQIVDAARKELDKSHPSDFGA